jgi:ribonuclease HII
MVGLINNTRGNRYQWLEREGEIMAWLIGIDEAGYGPNLGPLVMTSVACRVPKPLVRADLWQVLDKAVCRHPSKEDQRLFINDSKLVYTHRGLLGLEAAVLGVPFARPVASPLSVRSFLEWLCPASVDDLGRETWYAGATPLPLQAECAAQELAARQFQEACGASRITWGLVRSVVICPARFNALLEQWGSKGAVLAQGLAELLHCNRQPDQRADPIHVLVDKHGGRNTYTAIVQNALPDCMVLALEEGMARSSYRVVGAGRDIQLTFQPRAEAEHLCVALASMVSKYVRELLMQDFNAFWQRHVPGLKPTAGYPGDASRFFRAIQPVVQRLGIAEAAVWRRK